MEISHRSAQQYAISKHREMTEMCMKLVGPKNFKIIRDKGARSYNINRHIADHGLDPMLKHLPCASQVFDLIGDIGSEMRRERARRVELDLKRENPQPGFGYMPSKMQAYGPGKQFDPIKGLQPENYKSIKDIAHEKAFQLVRKSGNWEGQRSTLVVYPGPSAEIKRWERDSTPRIEFNVRPTAVDRAAGNNPDEADLISLTRDHRFLNRERRFKPLLLLGAFDHTYLDYENLEGISAYRIAMAHRRKRSISWGWCCYRKFADTHTLGISKDLEDALKTLRKGLAQMMLDAADETTG